MPLPSKNSMQEPKSASDLISDPHFIFTIFSLLASVCVFFYYLIQLFRSAEFRGTGKTYTPPASRKSSGSGKDFSTTATATTTDAINARRRVSEDGTSSPLLASSPAKHHLPATPHDIAKLEEQLAAMMARAEKRNAMLEKKLQEAEAAEMPDADASDGMSEPPADPPAVSLVRGGSGAQPSQAVSQQASGSELRKRRPRREE